MSVYNEQKICSTIGACPFAFSEESEIIQNYGCLPEPMEIIELKEKTGATWSCHQDETKICVGFARFAKQKRPDLKIKEGGLIDSLAWQQEGILKINFPDGMSKVID